MSSGTPKSTGAALVLGGGVAGIQCSLDLAEGGYKVYLVEKAPALGGHMAQLDKTFPTNDCSMCTLAPKLVEAGRHLNIEIVTNSELTGLEGEPGSFTAKIFHHARYVDPDKCTSCGECVPVCPVSGQGRLQRGTGRAQGHLQALPAGDPQHLRGHQEGPVALQARLRRSHVGAGLRGPHRRRPLRRRLHASPASPTPSPPSAAASARTSARPTARAARSSSPSPSPASSASSATGPPRTCRCPRPAEVKFAEQVAVIGGGPGRPHLRPRPGAAGLQDDRLREQGRGRRHAALRHPRVPAAQGRPAAGHRPHPRPRRGAASSTSKAGVDFTVDSC